jgi:hypothetical protein
VISNKKFYAGYKGHQVQDQIFFRLPIKFHTKLMHHGGFSERVYESEHDTKTEYEGS